MNSVNLVGRICNDPDYSVSEKGTVCCKFVVAVDSKMTDQTTGNKYVSFLNCIAWGKIGEFVYNYSGKGRLVSISGEIRSHSWTNQDGNKSYSTEIIVEYFNVLDKPKPVEKTSNKVVEKDMYPEIDINEYNPFA